MKSNQKFDAVLQDWQFNDATGSLRGRITNQTEERFPEGAFVNTSTVQVQKSQYGTLREGNVIRTRNSRYLLGKQANTTFPDGHPIDDSTETQLNSLRFFMRAQGYILVYTDSSVLWRREDGGPHARLNIAFEEGVRLHNAASAPSLKLVRVVKLQKSGNRIITQSHKVSYIHQVARYLAIV